MSIEMLASQLINWIKETVFVSKCRGVIFGMSGGIDSSVLAVLCSRAFPESCLGVIMPCHSEREDRHHAEMVAKTFEIPTKIIILDDTYDSFLTILAQNNSNSRQEKLARSNMKPRLRMMVLYYFANQMNYLVVGSSNKCELYVGYFTKYGDGATDILPLGNLVKSEISQLAFHLGVPDEIIHKPPSAGLWQGQTDEQEMGLSYNQLDRYLLTGEAEEGVKNRIELLAKMNSHKISLPHKPPPFII